MKTIISAMKDHSSTPVLVECTSTFLPASPKRGNIKYEGFSVVLCIVGEVALQKKICRSAHNTSHSKGKNNVHLS